MSDTQLPVRELGATGLTVTRLGLGLAAVGRPAYINSGRQEDLGSDRSVAALERRCHEMLDAAYAAGIRYIDAARSYGEAEHFLGTWLRTRNPPRNAFTIGSKWGYSYVGSWRLDAPVHEVKDLSIDTLRRQIGESRSQLGDRLQLYQIHSATLESGILENESVLRELLQLRSTGLFVGLTVSGPAQPDVIRRALEVDVDGINPFQVVQATWNLLERSAGAALAEAKCRGWGVIVKEALANGRLTERGDGGRVALAAALSQPWADVVLSGAVTIEQLGANLEAVALSHESVEWPDVAESPAEYWMRRSQLPWR